MDVLWEKAREIGRLVAQSDEYKVLKRANERLSDDRDTVAGINRLGQLQESIGQALQAGEEPAEAEREEFERLAGSVQTSSTYQAFEAARSNFDRLMMRIDEEIAKGIEAGEQSRIILT
ncbi:YlbF family regulator [Longimicrobium sp.]|uniref:YlbF family regulator n=1 Tax=Longimicrobium sp. TaxID=2029185 RepID=UPI002B92C35C|nr:YlbF family regulator [Longimicrobium sp.]HSU15761.1 YlbF family regulator [Longimicrobium sp.]